MTPDFSFHKWVNLHPHRICIITFNKSKLQNFNTLIDRTTYITPWLVLPSKHNGLERNWFAPPIPLWHLFNIHTLSSLIKRRAIRRYIQKKQNPPESWRSGCTKYYIPPTKEFTSFNSCGSIPGTLLADLDLE